MLEQERANIFVRGPHCAFIRVSRATLRPKKAISMLQKLVLAGQMWPACRMLPPPVLEQCLLKTGPRIIYGPPKNLKLVCKEIFFETKTRIIFSTNWICWFKSGLKIHAEKNLQHLWSENQKSFGTIVLENDDRIS